MAQRRQQGSGMETGTPPPSTPSESSSALGRDHSFTLQTVMEMQKTLGKLEHAVNLLVTSEADTKAKIGRIEKVIYAAGIVMIICLTLGGWMLTTAKDFAMTYYKASLETQRISATQQAPSAPSPVPPPSASQGPSSNPSSSYKDTK